MKNAENTDCRFGYCIRRDVRCAADHKFACTSNPSNTTACRKINETANGSHDPFVDQNGGRRVIGLNKGEDGVAIR